jgi:hypothetical protein
MQPQHRQLQLVGLTIVRIGLLFAVERVANIEGLTSIGC